VWIPVKSDYALRAIVLIAAAWPDAMVKADALATTASIPVRFLENILGELRRAGLIRGRRGYHGGYSLTRSPAEIDLAQVLAAVSSPLVAEPVDPGGALGHGAFGDGVDAVWAAVDVSTRGVLERLNLADLVGRHALQCYAPPADPD
jgi:Rrf2 family protein